MDAMMDKLGVADEMLEAARSCRGASPRGQPLPDL
jgi:hypothetical protein